MMHQSSCTRPTRGEHPLWRTTGYMQLRKKMLVYTLESFHSVCVCGMWCFVVCACGVVCVLCGGLLCMPVVLCVVFCCVFLCCCVCVMWCVPLVLCVLCGMVCACGGVCVFYVVWCVCVIWCGVFISRHYVWVKVVSHYNQDGLAPNPGEILRRFCPQIRVWGWAMCSFVWMVSHQTGCRLVQASQYDTAGVVSLERGLSAFIWWSK